MTGSQKMKTKITRYENKEQQENSLAEEIAGHLKKITAEGKIAHLLLSGGSTPINMYAKLFTAHVNWDKVKMYLVDERFVPVDDTSSNEKMIREQLQKVFGHSNAFEGMVYDIDNKENNLEILKKKYSDIDFENSVIVLGMGNDGHFASLFPKDSASEKGLDKNAPNLMNTFAPSEPKKRISLSAAAICQSPNVFLMITGESKMKVLEEAIAIGLPISYMLENKPEMKIIYAD
jgi:6-phosphogluconolactonase